jgi:hypothetical protein
MMFSFLAEMVEVLSSVILLSVFRFWLSVFDSVITLPVFMKWWPNTDLSFTRNDPASTRFFA